MYARDIPSSHDEQGGAENRTLTLVVSGQLWEQSMVMKDLETGSLWSHLLGEAMAGPLVGTRLTMLPAVVTGWGTWKEMHPHTTVVHLSRISNSFRGKMYADPQQFLIGLVHDGAARAWTFPQLQQTPIINDKLKDLNVLVVLDKPSGAACIYDRTLDGRALLFVQREGEIIDGQTGSKWNGLHMQAREGPLTGKQLRPLPGVVSYQRPWQLFHPESTYFPE